MLSTHARPLSLKAAPDARPHCLVLGATIAARSAATVRSEPAHLETACSGEPQPPLGLMKRGPTPPNSHFHSPGCAPAGFNGSNGSFVCVSRKTMTEIVQGSSISFSEISCPGAPVSRLQFSPRSRELCISPHLRAAEMWKEAGLWATSPALPPSGSLRLPLRSTGLKAVTRMPNWTLTLHM